MQIIFDQGHEIVAMVPLKGVIEQHIIKASGDIRLSRKVCEEKGAVCITKDKIGRLSTCDGGIDSSNHPSGVVSFLPEDPDRVARTIRNQIQELTGKQIAVILADTEMVPFGTMDFAIGSAGIEPRAKAFGKLDLFENPKFGGMDLVANELTAASVLVFGQVNEGIPAVIIRGYQFEINETENIANTVLSHIGNEELARTIRLTMQTTAYAKNLKWRLFLKIASWFV